MQGEGVVNPVVDVEVVVEFGRGGTAEAGEPESGECCGGRGRGRRGRGGRSEVERRRVRIWQLQVAIAMAESRFGSLKGALIERELSKGSNEGLVLLLPWCLLLFSPSSPQRLTLKPHSTPLRTTYSDSPSKHVASPHSCLDRAVF